jgi:hypothetical protein
MNYYALVEWLCPDHGVVRVYDSPDGRMGEPYEWAATIVRVRPGVVEFRGVCRPLSLAGMRALRKALAAEGVTAHESVRVRSPRV